VTNSKIVKIYLAIWLLWFISLLVSSMMGNRPSHLPVRVIVVPFLLLTPFAGYTLNHIFNRSAKIGKISAILIIIVISTIHFNQLTHYPPVMTSDLRKIVQGINVLWETKFFARTDSILMERHGWDYIPVQALTLQPDQVWVDSSPPAGLRVQVSPLILSNGQITEAYLKTNHFKLVIAHSITATNQLNQFMLPVAQMENYHVFIYPADIANFQIDAW
jgi:hypothetical protein